MGSNGRRNTAISGLAAALWERECRRNGVDAKDRRLVANLPRHARPATEEAIRDLPSGVAGVAALAESYLASVPRALRTEHGRFYTPLPLAEVLAERALKGRVLPDGLVVDPACGAGSLLGAAAEYFVRTSTPCEALSQTAERIRGTDIDSRAVGLCELAIRVALLPAWAAARDDERPTLPRFAETRDGLGDRRSAAVVLANPPFGRCRISPDERHRHRDVLYGHAHWPSLFLHSAVERLTPHGVAAFIVPASLVGGAYYQRLRAYVTAEAPPDWLAFVDDRDGVFSGGVLQETLLATFVRGRMIADVSVQRVSNTDSRRRTHTVSARGWRRHQSWLIPRDDDDLRLIRRASQRERRLGDYGWSVSTGPLVWNRHKDQLSNVGGSGRLRVVWASDIRGGRVDADRLRQRRFITVSEGQDWLLLKRPAVLVQRTTAPEQHRRLVAAVLDAETLARLGGAVVVENHLNVCIWNGDGVLNAERLVGFLRSEEADRLYRCMTGSVAVSAFELKQLPLPDPEELVAEDTTEDARAA